MAPLDWDNLMSVRVDSLEDDPETSDDLFVQLAEFDPGGEDDNGRLRKLFFVTQAVMVVKGSQAEVAEEEMAKMAEDESKSTTKMQQELAEARREIADLKRTNKEIKTLGAAGGSRDMRFVREELSEMEDQISQLQREIKEKDRIIQDERTAAERNLTRADEAEGEVKELKRENEQNRVDLRNYQRQLDVQRENMRSKQDDDVEFRDKMTSKNKVLNAALEENKMLGEANAEMEAKLDDMRKRLNEARDEMEKTAEDFLNLRLVVTQSDKMLEDLRRENEMLRDQVDDLQEQVRSKTDADDEIMVQVNSKVEEWKGILADKEDEIQVLQQHIVQMREQLTAANMDSEKASVAALTKALEERNRKIEVLKRNLDDAVGNLHENASLLENVRQEMSKGGGKGMENRTIKKMTNLQATLQNQEELLLDAEKRAQQAEKDAQEKDKALSEALERMRQYEMGEYGLAEAVSEIKECKNKMSVKDRQVEEFIQMLNKSELRLNDLHDENDSLREKLGIPLADPIDLSDFRIKKNQRMQEDRGLVICLQKELEQLEDERMRYKLENRKLAQAAGKRAVKMGIGVDDILTADVMSDAKLQKNAGEMPSMISGQQPSMVNVIKGQAEQEELRIRNRQLDEEITKNQKTLENFQDDNVKMRARMKEMDTENKQLHEALKEINAALKEQGKVGDGINVQTLECPALSRMVAAIDAKSLRGEYDTSLYLKAQVDNLTGHNEELRRELREVRFEATKAKVELDRAQIKVEGLEGEVKTLREVGAGAHFQATPLPEGMAITSSEVIASLNEHLVHVLQEVSLKEEMVSKMEESLDDYKRKFAVMRHQQGLLYQTYINEKKAVETSRDDLMKELDELKGKHENNQVRIQEFDRLVDTLAQDEVEVRRRLSDMTRKITVLRVNEKSLARRYNAVNDLENTMRKESNKLKCDMMNMEAAVAERLGYLTRYKDMASFKIAALQKALDDSVPSSELDIANRHYTELTEKYRDLLEKSNNLVASNESSAGFEAEIKRLEAENQSLKTTMEVDKDKLHSLEAAFENMRKQGLMNSANLRDSDVISMSKRLTTLEMKELNERQRAEHAVKLYDVQKGQLRTLEDRNMELETKFAELTRMNLEAQKVERELRDDLANCVTKAVSDADRRRISELEKSEMLLKDEVAKLRDISEVATSQSRTLDAQQISRDKEVQSLRQQLLDFQSQSDEKTVIGKLHRHIVALQVSEGTAVRKLEDAKKKILKLEAQLYRCEQRVDERDNAIYHNRQESRSKTKHLKHTIQDLRHKFSGSVPLQTQEKFSQAMVKLQADKAKIEEDLRKTNEERLNVEDKLAELEVQHKGMSDLIITLKDGKGAQKVAEWHSKMETIRLEEVRHKRQIDRLRQQVQFLEGIIKKHETEVLLLEEDRVRMNKEFETRELEWEQRELELERIIASMERQQADIAGAASQFEVAVGSLPDPNWPVAKQLEHAVETIKKNVKLIMDAKAEAQVAKKRQEELEQSLKGKTKEVTARDRVITELRLRLPASAERDQAIAKATAVATKAGETEDTIQDYEGKQAVRVAQSTVASLQARVNQKEETIAKYQELLSQAREDMAGANKRHEMEMNHLQQKLHSKTDAAFTRFKQSAVELVSKADKPVPSNDQLKRLNELEDIVADQDNSISALRDKLSKARQEIQEAKLKTDQAIRTHSHEKEDLLKQHASDLEALQKEIADLESQVDEKQKELDIAQGELELQKEANQRAPTTAMKGLVERLKNQLSLKEKQHQALSKALMELRADMVKQAQDEVKANADTAASEQNVQKIVMKETKNLQETVEEKENQLQKLRKDAKKFKDRSEAFSVELDETRSELTKKENLMKKYKDDKARLEAENEQLERKVERMSTMQKQHGQADTVKTEIDELRRKNRLLNDELKRAKHQPEKPYEQTTAKEQHTGEEAVARWEESKKWQKMVDRLKVRLKEKEAEIEKLMKTSDMLKNGLDRANRDKENLEHKLKMASRPNLDIRPSGAGGQLKATPITHSVEDLRRRNYNLEEEVAQLKRRLLMSRDTAMEEVQLRNKFLTERLETLEQQLPRRSGSAPSVIGPTAQEYQTLASRENKLQKDIIKLSEENVELKFEVEQARHDIPRLKERVDDLQKYVDIIKQEKAMLQQDKSIIQEQSRSLNSSLASGSSSNVRRIGESGKTTKELEKTISLLKKVVERTQAENEALKKGSIGGEQVQHLQTENEVLKSQLEELRHTMGATLSDRYSAKEKGAAKVVLEHERIRKELVREKENAEKFKLKIRQQELTIEQLNKDLSSSKSQLEIEKARQLAGGASFDAKGLKSGVVARMYEGKLKALEEDLEKKNKMLSDVRVLLREAAEREQNLTLECKELTQKIEILERFPPGRNASDADIVKEYQLARLTIDRLECEKKELINDLQIVRQRVNIEGGAPTELDDEVLGKLCKYDSVLTESVDVRTQLKTAQLERDEAKAEVIKLTKELENFGPDFFEEIEDLKYNYREAVERNVKYEDQLSQLSQQFGVDVDIPSDR